MGARNLVSDSNEDLVRAPKPDPQPRWRAWARSRSRRESYI